MPLPQKRWARVADVAKRWGVEPSDVEDYAVDELLKLYVYVADLRAEEGTLEPDDHGGIQKLPQRDLVLNGPQPLLRQSLLAIIRDGQAEIRNFRPANRDGYLRIQDDVRPLLVRRSDLIITSDEREDFERQHGLSVSPTQPGDSDPSTIREFRVVQLGKDSFKFGPKQAAVLRLLKTAGESGKPWRKGSELLAGAEAETSRMSDLFKRHPAWRRLIMSDGKGHYRLIPELLSPERRRQFPQCHTPRIDIGNPCPFRSWEKARGVARQFYR